MSQRVMTTLGYSVTTVLRYYYGTYIVGISKVRYLGELMGL